MKRRFKILGTRRFGEAVRLIIEPSDIVKEKQQFNPMTIMSDPDGIQTRLQEMQNNVMIQSMPDTITISYEEWQKHKYNTDDIVWIEVTPE